MKKVCILTLMLLFTMALYVKNAVALNLPVSEGYGQDWLAPEGVLKVDPEGYHTPVGKVNGDPSILPAKQLEETPIFITVMNAFLSLKNGCWLCPVFTKIYDVTNTFATKLYKSLRSFFLSFLAILAFGWLLYHVFKFVITLHAPNIGEFMTQIFKTLGSVLIASALLAPSASFLNGYFIEMPTLFGISLCNDILKGVGMGGKTVTYITYKAVSAPDGKGGSSYTYKPKQETFICTQSDASKYKGLALSANLHDEMICLVQKVSLRLIRGIAMGVAFIDQSFVILKAMPLLTLHPVLMSVAINWEMLFVGLLITFAYFSLFVKIPFKVIDLVLKLCFVIIMLPVFIVCYPFQATRGYSKKGWNLLLSVLVEMLSLCVFIGLALALIDHGLVNS